MPALVDTTLDGVLAARFESSLVKKPRRPRCSLPPLRSAICLKIGRRAGGGNDQGTRALPTEELNEPVGRARRQYEWLPSIGENLAICGEG
jgi:hypothetical protein